MKTSPKDGENHSASLSNFLLLSRRNEESSRLGQKFKDELAEPKPPQSTFCDTSYHVHKLLLFWFNSILLILAWVQAVAQGSRKQVPWYTNVGSKTHWQKCSGTGFHLSLTPMAPSNSKSCRFKTQRIGQLISAQSHSHNVKPFQYRAQFVLERDNRTPDLTMRSLSQREVGIPWPRALVTLE